jgi:hypothetical protein
MGACPPGVPCTRAIKSPRTVQATLELKSLSSPRGLYPVAGRAREGDTKQNAVCLTDPNKTLLQAKLRGEDELVISTGNGRLPRFNNVGNLSDEIVDGVCPLSTWPVSAWAARMRSPCIDPPGELRRAAKSGSVLLGFTTSASRLCHVSSPSILPIGLSV